jgi:hypothetical protein
VSNLAAQRPRPNFWLLQIGGWTAYGLASAISYIPFRHMRESVDYHAAFLGTTFLASFIIHSLCRALWRRSTSLTPAMFYSVLLSYVLGVLCTALSAVTALHLARLDRAQFVRIHRSTIVQVERILRIEPASNRDAILTLRGGTALRVSRSHRSRLKKFCVDPRWLRSVVSGNVLAE